MRSERPLYRDAEFFKGLFGGSFEVDYAPICYESGFKGGSYVGSMGHNRGQSV